MVKLAVEIGGTFTDLIWLDHDGQVHIHKVPSTPDDPSAGVIIGIEEALGDRVPEVTVMFHGSTVATNAILERKGSRAGLLTTKGFRDVLVIQRQLRNNVYSIISHKPEPIIPLSHTVEARERVTADGSVQLSLDEEQLLNVIEQLVEERQIDALAISFLHSYQNPTHEQLARDLVARRYPELKVILSSDVLPTFREYERASTTAMAAYVAPIVDRYLSHLEEHIHEQGCTAPLFVMQSSGGVLPSAGIRSRPVEMLQSGPAAGVIAAIRVGERLHDPDLITLDMGGTSTDVCLVRDGVAEVSSEREVDGLPLGIPSVDIANVGAGGGSIGWIDRGGMLHVGPQSAGARPGPACYGHGGTAPTITDALVHLGWLRPHGFLGGRMPLYRDRATSGLSNLTGPVAETTDAAAQAMIDIGVAHINRAVRLVSVQRGHDPQGYTLYAYGGMGPMVGALVAEEMRIRRVVIPPHPGLFSALGLLVTDLERTYRQTSFTILTDQALPEIVAVFDRLQAEAAGEFATYGYRPEQLEVHAQLEMRYRGQGFELLVPVDLGRLASEGVPYAVQSFHDVHRARYGTRAPVDTIEIVTFRLVARVLGSRDALDLLHQESMSGDTESEDGELIFHGVVQPCQFLWRDGLSMGQIVKGLAIIEEPTATALVPPGWQLRVESAGALVLEKEETT